MIRFYAAPLGALLSALVALPAAALDYPNTRKGDVVDNYHGTQVADPYRWLEDTDSEATAAWVEAQNTVTFGVLDKLPKRDAFKDRLTEIWNYERYSVPSKRGNRYFFRKNDGLQNQSVLYVQEGLNGTPRVLIDPNTLSDDGTVSLASTSVSPDGQWLAYALADGGSDWRSVRVKNIASGEDLLGSLENIKFSGMEWTKDSRGFFYSRYPGKDGTFDDLANQKLYYHRIGTLQSEDVLVHERPDQPKWGFYANVTEDGRHALIGTWKGAESKNRLALLDLKDPDFPQFDGPIVPIVDDFESRYEYEGSAGDEVFLFTTENAPRGKIVAVNVQKPAKKHWRTVRAEDADTIEGIGFVGGKLIVIAMRDAAHRMHVLNTSGKVEREIKLPGLGSISAISGEADDTELFFGYESYLQPDTNYRTDLATGKVEVFQQPQIDFDTSRFATEQVFYTSKDGTRVPMFITYKKGLKRDGHNRTLLYGYGGFNVSLTPSFSISRLGWLDAGGVLAVANLRGGGEYGEAWHKAGTRENKQNVFDDFIAAGEYLVKNKWTMPHHLGIQGGSNGGLLVGAVANQRPDLFAVALPAVGVMDMLRFHKFTIGWAWTPDYGSSDDPEGFEYLYAYSPLHNIKQGVDYPATLVTTADHDDRVVPGHSFKYAAALQAAHAGKDPVLIRIETRAGHGAGKPTSKRIAEAADLWAFLWEYTGKKKH